MEKESRFAGLTDHEAEVVEGAVFGGFRAGIVLKMSDLFNGVDREDLGSCELHKICMLGTRTILTAWLLSQESPCVPEDMFHVVRNPLWWSGLGLATAGRIEMKIICDLYDSGKIFSTNVSEMREVGIVLINHFKEAAKSLYYLYPHTISLGDSRDDQE